MRGRLDQYTSVLLRLLEPYLVPGASPDLLSRLSSEAVALLPPPDYGVVPVESLDLQLVFTHDCRCVRGWGEGEGRGV